MLQYSVCSFDIFVEEVFASLLNGAALAIPPDKPQSELERENRRYYSEALPAGNHIACFAYDEKKIIGCGGVCFHSEMPSPDNPNGKCAYLMNVYVLAEYRGRKIGKEIVTWLIRQAKNKEANKIYLESTDKGRYMYESLGFESLKNMKILKV